MLREHKPLPKMVQPPGEYKRQCGRYLTESWIVNY